jgi:rfaE bifunctional protein nucleotidyltransferase chain/domain
VNTSGKIVSVSSLKAKIKAYRRSGRVIAFTNGCFDIVHVGHVSYLEKAKGQNRVLIVGLNSDASVRRIKGKDRPVNDQRSRAKVLAALACVDHVCIFSEDTPLRLIKAVSPDVLIKGADWKKSAVVGADHVQSYGGRVELIKFVKGYSTSAVLKTIQSL